VQYCTLAADRRPVMGVEDNAMPAGYTGLRLVITSRIPAGDLPD
jgi:hypothetical protein